MQVCLLRREKYLRPESCLFFLNLGILFVIMYIEIKLIIFTKVIENEDEMPIVSKSGIIAAFIVLFSI